MPALLLPLLLAAAVAADVPPRRPMFQPSIAPDRPEVVFVSGGDLWTGPLAGGEAHLLVSHPATESRPIYSPDGTRLAFVSTRTGGGDIYVLTLATGDLTRVTFGDTADLLDAWSRDGQWLYFTSSQHEVSGRSNVFRVRPVGGTPMPVLQERYVSEYWVAPSPNGDALALTAKGIVNGQWWRHGHSHIDESEIWVRTGTTYQSVTTGGAKSAWPMWTADGRRLLYMSDRSGAENLWEQRLGGTPRQLTRFTTGRVLWPSIGYDGKTVVFERDLGLWRMDVGSGKATPIALSLRGAPAGEGTQRLVLQNRFADLVLSPDGRKVAFVARGDVFAAASKEPDGAERLTRTEAAESRPVWAPDSRRIAYTSRRSGQYQVWLYDFATGTETALTTDAAGAHSARWSPDGKSLAFLRGRHRLMVLDMATRIERELTRGEFGLPPLASGRAFAWSPDSQWIAFYAADARRFSNLHLVPAAGGAARQITFAANTFGDVITWAPDGTYLLFESTQRTEPGAVGRVDLVKRTPRFREDRFRELFREETPRNTPAAPATTPPLTSPSQTPGTPATTLPAPATPGTATPTSAAAANPAPGGSPRPLVTPPPKVTVAWDDIRRRLSMIPAGVSVNEHVITPDGKTLVLAASAAGQTNLYTWSLDETSKEPEVARQVTSTPGPKSNLQVTSDGKDVFFLDQGRIASVTLESRQVKALPVTADLEVSFDRGRQEVFEEAWTYLRDWFYDQAYHGADWNALRATYAPYVSGSANADELRKVLSLMIGELDASHLGISAPPDPAAGGASGTGRLGLQFDVAEYEANGRFRIASVLPLGPADVAGDISVGQYLLAVDGTALDREANLDALLSARVGRRTVLRIGSGVGAADARDVAVLPASTGTEVGLAYRQWVEERRARVLKASGGRLGYVHIRDMSGESLAQLYLDLDSENQARDGVVIDIRNNNGGFVNAYALDVFTRRPYLSMTYRGSSVAAPARSMLGQRSLERPTVLVTNHGSLSDAEDFTEGYRALEVGRVVGEPTAGWIIYTTNVGLTDGSQLRLPFIRIRTASGEDMERHPRPVDVRVDLTMGEDAAGEDHQLDRAVRELLADLGRAAEGRAAEGRAGSPSRP